MKKMNNKGFSLVELIIVIAIMAVLIGVLAPAYLRYVEKSRKSADVQAIDAVMSAMEAAAIDPSLKMSDDDTMTVVMEKSGITITATVDAGTNVVGELTSTIGTAYQLKASDWTKIGIQGKVSGGQVTFTYEEAQTESGKKLLDYATDLNVTAGDVY